MSSAESHIRHRIVVLLKRHRLDPVSVENPVHPGTPDLNYLHGWIELKQVARWPSRGSTPLRVPTYTQQQRVWAKRRRQAGGLCYLLLRVAEDWLLFDGGWASAHLGYATASELIAASLGYWPRRLNEEELVTCLLAT